MTPSSRRRVMSLTHRCLSHTDVSHTQMSLTHRCLSTHTSSHTYECICGDDACLYATVVFHTYECVSHTYECLSHIWMCLSHIWMCLSHVWMCLRRRRISLCLSHLTCINVFVATSHVSMHQSSHTYKCICGDESCLYAHTWSHTYESVLCWRVMSLCVRHVTHECSPGDESFFYAWVISHILIRSWRRVVCLCMSYSPRMNVFVSTSHVYAWVMSHIWICLWRWGMSVCKSLLTHMNAFIWMHDTGWRRLIGSPKLQIIFHKRATKYRSLLRKMTYKDKGSFEFSPPCMNAFTWMLYTQVCAHV